MAEVELETWQDRVCTLSRPYLIISTWVLSVSENMKKMVYSVRSNVMGDNGGS